MELNAYTVNWHQVCNLYQRGDLEEEMMSDDDDAGIEGFEDPPWPSDSCIQFCEVSECLAKIIDMPNKLDQNAIIRIQEELFRGEFVFPEDLGQDVNGELIAGSYSPDRVRDLNGAFEKLDYPLLDQLFDNLPIAFKSKLGISTSDTREVFSGYIQQWAALFACAAKRNAGVFIHLG